MDNDTPTLVIVLLVMIVLGFVAGTVYSGQSYPKCHSLTDSELYDCSYQPIEHGRTGQWRPFPSPYIGPGPRYGTA